MRPLLWKEMRDLRAWLLAGTGVIGALELLLLTKRFDPSFVSVWMEVLMPLASALVAIGLAVGQIARERHARTLDFLLVRPVSAGVIVWSKFLAGTSVLAVLLAGIVSLGFSLPQYTSDAALQAIREQVSQGQMLATLLPRYWFLYALALCFSVLVDRSAKAAALAVVLAVTLVASAESFVDLAPFSGFVYWLPFFDLAGGLVDAARSASLSGMTGIVYAACAFLVTWASAALLKHSPERYLGNRGILVSAVAVIAVAVASAHGAANRLPEVAPLGSWECQTTGDWSSFGIVAEGGLVAVSLDHRVRFLDFTQPSHPRQIADVQLPLWTTTSGWSVDDAAMADGTLFLVGQKKAVPVDELEIAMLKPERLIGAILLGPVRAGDYTSTPLPVDGFVYLGVTQDRVCGVRVFDLASKREVASLTIDRLRPPTPGRDEGSPPVRMLRRGSYLYVASPSYLTAIDISKPAQPAVTSQVPVRPKVSSLYGFPRPLAWQDDRLFEIHVFPESLASYDVSDPAHPVAEAEFTYHERGGMTMSIGGSGRALYRPWQSGVLEFHAEGDDLHARRYLVCDGAVSALAMEGDFVYALTAADKKNRRTVQAFRVEKEKGSK